MANNKPTMAVIGAGRAGTAFGAALLAAGYHVVAVTSRRLGSARVLARKLGCAVAARPEQAARLAEVVWITTPDRAIGPVARAIASSSGFRPGQCVFHVSGALTADILAPARQQGAAVASVHPLQSLTKRTTPADLVGCSFALEGDEAALLVARPVVASLGGVVLPLRAKDKVLYHAAACITSNYLVALLDVAVGLLTRCGTERGAATAALLPLAQGTLNNISRLGVRSALTGPLARGDLETLQKHVAALGHGVDGETADLYARLGCYTTQLAEARGDLSPSEAGRLRQELQTLLKGADNDVQWATGDHRHSAADEKGRSAGDHAHRL